MNTEKQIKDYLHLYIGCEVIVPDEKEPDVLVCVYDSGGYISGGCDYPFSEIKLLLRPLSDMTPDESAESIKIGNADRFDTLGKIQVGAGLPMVFHYLLSRGFDLFSLIPEGLALDKTLLTPKQPGR